jgi:RsmE family RNA methyltransferase
MNIILFKDQADAAFLGRHDSRFSHIVKILKKESGESFRSGIVNGNSGFSKIERIDEKGMWLNSVFTETSQPMFPVTLLCGSARPPVTARILKDCTTMGIDNLVFVSSALSEKSYYKSKLWQDGKWEDSLVDGAVQAGVTSVPSVKRYYSLKKALENIKGEYKFFFSLSETAVSINEIVRDEFKKNQDRIVVAVGPERGWTDEEEKLFVEAGFQPLALGSRIYRTETAVTASLNLLFFVFKYI